MLAKLAVFGAIAALVCIFAFKGALVFHPQIPYQDERGEDHALAALLAHATSTEPFTVAKVIDGDTFAVNVGGGLATIRVLGINTPETVDPEKPVQCFGKEASAEAHVLLDGQTVSLSSDPTQDPLDKYGRVLAYITLASGASYNETMIKNGYAFEYTYDKPYEYQAQFRAAEAAARAASLGLWAPSTCDGKLIPE